jgi:hypothetical protein
MADPNWSAVEAQIKDSIMSFWKAAQLGTAEMLTNYASQIASRMVMAVQQGDKALTDELATQIKALAEVHQIRLSRNAGNLLTNVVGMGIKILAAALA